MTKESTPPPVSPSPPRLCQIGLTPTFEGYGFNLHTMKGKTGQFVGKIDPGSPAAEAGLKEGDRLLEVNGSDITNETHSQVVTRIKMVPGRTNLLVIDREGAEWYDKHGIIVTSELPEVLIGSSGAVTVKEAESRSASSESEEEEEGSDSEGEKNQAAELKHEEKKTIENQAFVEELKTVTEKVLADEETKAETTISSLKEEDLEENVDSGTEDPHPVEEVEHPTEIISSPDSPDGSHDDGKPIDEAIETSTPEPDNLASSSASESASVTSEVSTDSPKDAASPSDAAVTTTNEIAENQEEKEENASNASSSASSTTEEEETSPIEKMVDPPKPEESSEKTEDNADWVWDQPVAKKEVLPHPAPVASPTPRSPPDDGLDLPTSAAEMRRILSSRKRKDPRKEVMDARRKYDIIQAL